METVQRPRAPAVIPTTADDTADGPIKCKVCGKVYAQKQNLNRHAQTTHLGGISRHDALKRHLDNIHKLSDLEAKEDIALGAAGNDPHQVKRERYARHSSIPGVSHCPAS
ncbi:hypothetical protein IEO21_09842 [Rhodonia placenta]|uniref:C2H2-type domain-containing protein n=1 Tax=Rhodonia placenta TaxID=104341 RepID=A0A8H7NTI8_9APHY|nr:hypothetical protein IEO21_09842 [Postia placenta]